MFCSNCGSQIVDNSRFCPNCGSPIQQTQYVAQPMQYQSLTPVQPQAVYQSKVDGKWTTKKDSTLSIVALVLSLFTITAFAGFICAIIDLVKNDEEYRHSGAKFALWFDIIFFVCLILIL